MTNRYRWAVPIAVAMVLAAGCTGGSSDSSRSAGLRSITCPEDVDVQIVGDHACFRLTVPRDRRHPDAGTVNLFVLRIRPPGRTSPDPILDVTGDVGDMPEYGGMAPQAERVHRVAYFLDPRGSGHSEPLLTCPEAHQITASTPHEAHALATSAARCEARLRADGVNPADYTPADVAADAEDLRRALDVPRWNVISLGTTSVYAVAIATAHPDTTRALILDSPAPFEPVSAAAMMTAAWHRLVAECAKSARCHRAFPHLSRSYRDAVGTAPTGVSSDALLRGVRSLLAGPGPEPAGRLPATVAAVRSGSIPAELRHRLNADADACVGLRPECGRQHSLGALLTALCPTMTSAVDPLDGYGPACRSWGSPAEPQAPPTTVPVLVMYGALDPFADATGIDALRSKTTFVVRVPHQSHNVLGYDECPIALRNAWIDSPEAAPPTQCLASMPALPFTTGGQR